MSLHSSALHRKWDGLLRHFIPWLLIGLWIVTASGTLIESYAYRYSAILLILYAGYRYLTTDARPATPWQGWLCIGWGLYALGRFLFQYLFSAGHPAGDAELLYAMPLAFPILGFAILLSWSDMERLVAVYFGVALATLVATTGYLAIFRGETVRPLIQHNQIHGAVCCGVILIAAIFWLVHYLTHPMASKRLKTYATLVSPLICVLCLICIYGAKSKGVWLSLGVCSPFLLFAVFRSFSSKAGHLLIVGVAIMVVVGIYEVRSNLDRTAGPTVVSTVALAREIAAGAPVGADISARIADSSTPYAMDERLQLWSNAWELLASAPIFGLGNAWESRWHHTHYTAVDYNAMHNGYLEILVRYGVVGLLIFAIMVIGFIGQVQRAVRLGVIPPAASRCYWLVQLFFALTLLSNSNNRLVIGETIIMLSFAFALACGLRSRRTGKISSLITATAPSP